MRNLNFSKLKSIGKGWHIGDYLRQFSIVVAGIIVTFWGSDKITEHSRQKEVSAMMNLVAEELEQNRLGLKAITARIDIDRHMAKVLLDHKLDVSTIPEDTLQKYSSFFYYMEDYDYTVDALDVLKGSSLMQYIPDKRLLQDVLQNYYRLYRARKDINTYFQMRKDVLLGYAFSGTKEEAIKELTEPDQGLKLDVSNMLDYEKFINYTRQTPNILDWQSFTLLDKELSKQVRILHEKYN